MSEQVGKLKLYLAILNNGYIRRELSYDVIPRILTTPGVDAIWENPSLTWASPISSNRNRIVKRFLSTDCDYLLMIDNDVVPLFNPAMLVNAKLAILGCPAKVRSDGQIIAWTAYADHPGGDAYVPINLDEIDVSTDIVEVKVVGSGCLLMRRDVFENPAMKAPFHSEFDEDGIQQYGTDFAFCRKAAKAGYKIHTTVNLRCEHFKTIGLNDITGYDTPAQMLDDNTKYKWPWGDMSIKSCDWKFIRSWMEREKVTRVLEFGSGLSSLLMAEHATVCSFETNITVLNKVMQLHQEYAKSIGHQPTLYCSSWNGKERPVMLASGNHYDMVFVDGPQSIAGGGVGREKAVELASHASNLIILHDAGRPEDMQWQRKFLMPYYNLVARSNDSDIRCHVWKHKSLTEVC